MGKINNVIRIPTSLDGKFFQYWLEFLRPFHNFTDKEIQVAACFLKHRYKLSKVIKDESLLDKWAMSEDTKRKVAEECNIPWSNLQVFLTKLKKKNMLVDGKINPKFIPHLGEDKTFSLLLHFELQDE